ncbi:thioredoxin domain-containing protein [Roseovarius salinarum]|uniref:hypothetical protein n=1 Tax=Roseovarius salinarum TaxID=1981892 RepID=UPI000C33F04E|nr:hypothetical protein [Roseovarius salinarum]
MTLRFLLPALLGIALMIGSHGRAAELIMVERKGCHYCIAWKEDLGPIYPKTDEGAFAPLRIVDMGDAPPPDVTFDRDVVFTPTFVLVRDGAELGRIEGYPGEDFFWGLLAMLLEENTDFAPDGKSN